MACERIAVFGAGGLGGYFAATLARAGFRVGVVARGAQLEAIRERGILVESPQGEFRASPWRASHDPAEIGEVDAVILAVKAWQVPEAARAMPPLIGPATRVLPLLNGVEAHEQLAETLERRHVLVGLCRIISSLTAPGRIRDAGVPATVALGEMDGKPLSREAAALAEEIGRAAW